MVDTTETIESIETTDIPLETTETVIETIETTPETPIDTIETELTPEIIKTPKKMEDL